MRTKLTIFITSMVLFFSNSSFGQDYFPFQTQNATWTVRQYGYGTNPPETTTYHVGIAGDTILNGLTYHKLYQNPGQLGFPNPEPKFNLATAYYFAAFREDASKKVWLHAHQEQSEDILYYDFGLNLADTFCFVNQPSSLGNLCVPVTKVDSILINGTYRRQIHFDHEGQQDSWIEGIGSTVGSWIGVWSFIGNIEFFLNCYGEVDFSVFGDCKLSTSNEDFPQESIAINCFPNPVNEFLYFNVDSDRSLILSIYDTNGVHLSTQSFNHTLAIQTKDFNPGIYFYTIQDKDHLLKSGKILKE